MPRETVRWQLTLLEERGLLTATPQGILLRTPVVEHHPIHAEALGRVRLYGQFRHELNALTAPGIKQGKANR